ncbi:oligosaccharide flippase family protein [Bacteroides fragilis]
MSKPLKAGIWYSASNIMLRSVSIITAPIFTRLLTTEDYGKISNFTSWQNILAIFMGVFLNYSIGRAKIDFKDDLKVIFLLFKVFLVLLVC